MSFRVGTSSGLHENEDSNLYFTGGVKADGQCAFFPLEKDDELLVCEAVGSARLDKHWKNRRDASRRIRAKIARVLTAVTRQSSLRQISSAESTARKAGVKRPPSKCASRTVERLPGGKRRRGE